MTSGSLSTYYRNEIDELDVNNNARDCKSFGYKTKIVGDTPERLPQPGYPGDADQPAQPPVPSLSIEVNILLKYLSHY